MIHSFLHTICTTCSQKQNIRINNISPRLKVSDEANPGRVVPWSGTVVVTPNVFAGCVVAIPPDAVVVREVVNAPFVVNVVVDAPFNVVVVPAAFCVVVVVAATDVVVVTPKASLQK